MAISEIDKYVIRAYEAVHGSTLNLGDICKINVEDIPEHDLFTYSFPCQDLSLGGKRIGLGKETRSGLLYECEKIIEYHKPKYLLLENVKYLVCKKFRPKFEEWLNYLEGLGYTNYWKVLNAKDYGIPQNRERVFVISILGEHKPYEFPDQIPLNKCIGDILEDKVDEKYYVNKPFEIVYDNDKIIYNGQKITLPCVCASRGRNPNNPSSRLPGEHLEQRLEFNTKGTSNTITTVPKDNFVVDKTYRVRKLTPREYLRLMGMREDDIDKIQEAGISDRQQYIMGGNSIVVNVLEAIFKNLFLY